MFATLVASTFLFSCNETEILPKTIDIMNENNVIENSSEEQVLRQAENNTVEVVQTTLEELKRAFVDAGLEPISNDELTAIQTRTNGQAPNPTQCFLAQYYGSKLASDPNVLTTFDVVRARQVILFCGASNTETTQSEIIANQTCVTQYTGLAAAYNACLISWPNENNTGSLTNVVKRLT